MHVEDRPPFQPLEERLAGKPRDRALHTGVPKHLEGALRAWLEKVLRRTGSNESPSRMLAEALAQEAALRLGLPARASSLRRDGTSYVNAILDAPVERLHEVVDAVLYCYPRKSPSGGTNAPTGALNLSLEHAGSAYRVDESGRQLVLRVDATVEDAVAEAGRSATEQAGDFLRRAWQHAYGLTPDPTAAYKEAVRAVEEAFVPLVSPASTRGSLGTVCADLTNQQDKWELVLVDSNDQPGDIANLVGLLKQLWHGQRSRHGGGANSRDQTQAEAEAAVHLAALALHWVTNGALRKKS